MTTSHLHQRALIEWEFLNDFMCHSQKELYIPVLSLCECHSPCIKSVRWSHFHSSRNLLISNWWDERPFEGKQNSMVSTVSLWISTKSFNKSGWNFHPGSQTFIMCPKYLHLIFLFLFFFFDNLCQILERLFAFHFVPFSSSFCKCVSGSAFLRHTSLQLGTEKSISLWQHLARNATRPLRF